MHNIYVYKCMYIHIYTHIYKKIYLYINMYMYMCAKVCISKNVHVYTYIHTYIHVYIYICRYLCISQYCMHSHIQIRTHLHDLVNLKLLQAVVSHLAQERAVRLHEPAEEEILLDELVRPAQRNAKRRRLLHCTQCGSRQKKQK